MSHGFSADGGASWTWDEIKVLGSRLTSGFCAQITIGQAITTGPIYIAQYLTSGNSFNFVECNDAALSGSPPLWTYSYLHLDATTDLEIDLVDVPGKPDVPGPSRVSRSPFLVADPTDANRMFLVYQDRRPNSDAPLMDVDIFCRVLTRSGAFWSAGAPVRVNDDNVSIYPVGETDWDQWQPAAAVDSSGRLHIVYYDYREIVQSDDMILYAKFNVYYAVSVDAGATFTNIKLSTIPETPRLDFDPNMTSNNGGQSKYSPGEYPSIACNGNNTWIAYAGTSPDDLQHPDRSVIFVSKVKFR